MDYTKFNSHCKYFVRVTTKSYVKTNFTFLTDACVKINGKFTNAQSISPGDNIEFTRGSINYSFIVDDVDFYNVCT